MSHAEPGFILHWDLVVPCCHKSQSHLAFAFSYRDNLAIPPHTMPAVYPKVTGKYVSLCQKKSTEVSGQGKFHFVYFPPLSKIYCICLSIGWVCKSNVHQNYLKNTNICLTMRKKESSLKKQTS